MFRMSLSMATAALAASLFLASNNVSLALAVENVDSSLWFAGCWGSYDDDNHSGASADAVVFAEQDHQQLTKEQAKVVERSLHDKDSYLDTYTTTSTGKGKGYDDMQGKGKGYDGMSKSKGKGSSSSLGKGKKRG
ncbi:hypothetical protein ACA910_007039 [Epithemia clementina (nom. ined.)]